MAALSGSDLNSVQRGESDGVRPLPPSLPPPSPSTLLDDKSDSFHVNSDCPVSSPLFYRLPSYGHLRPGADGCLGISHVVAKRAGIETRFPEGSPGPWALFAQWLAPLPSPELSFPPQRRIKMNQQTFIELPPGSGHFVRGWEREDESDPVLARGVPWRRLNMKWGEDTECPRKKCVW